MPEGCRALVTNPPYGTDTPSHKGQEKSAMAMLRFVDHALRLTEGVQGQLALLVRFQWVAGLASGSPDVGRSTCCSDRPNPSNPMV